MRDVLFLHLSCILILIFKVIAIKHFSLLEDGKNFNWYEASRMCHYKKGLLVNGTHMSLRNNAEETLLNGGETWTSLQMVNGYMKEIGLNENFMQNSTDPRQQNLRYSKNLCVKITTRNELRAVQCTVRLPVICELNKSFRQETDAIQHMIADYSPIGNSVISTSTKLHTYRKVNDLIMLTNQNTRYSTRRKLVSVDDTDRFHISLSRITRQSQQKEECPPDYYFYKSYCIRETKNATWSDAYRDCFRNAIEKTPLDIKGNLENLKFINTLLDKLEKKGITSIWLTAQRKIGGGPFIYSGPIESKFNYNNYSTLQTLNITWSKHPIVYDNMVTNECLMLNILHRTLAVQSCDKLFPFVCLFPSKFWTQSITYDSFCKRRNVNSSCDSQSLTWREARVRCRQSDDRDLVGIVNERISNNSGNYYIGKQNTKLGNVSSVVLSDWLQSNTTDPLFCTFKDVLHVSCNEMKTFACLSSIQVKPLKLVIKRKNNWNDFMISSVNVMDISHLYGIRCYLNGKLIKKDLRTSITARQQGYLFCEVLTHTPVQLIKSDSILIENPQVLTFVSKIIVEEPYNAIHDFTFGADLHYKRILEDILTEYNVTVLNITDYKHLLTGREIQPSVANRIIVEFQIDVSAREEELLEVYDKISGLLNVSTLGNYQFKIIYLRNTKYCMPKEWKIPTDCKYSYTSRMTHIGGTDKCVQCNKIISLSCIGSFGKGALWEVVRTKKLSGLSPIKNTCSIDDANTRSTLTMMVSIYPEYSQPGNQNVTDFVRDFEDYYFGKEQNSTGRDGNSTVTIYSTSAFKGIKGFYTRQGEKFRTIEKDTTDLFKENITAGLYLNYNNTSILLAHFINPPAFPYQSGGNIRVSPVFLVKISSVNDVIFPIYILISLESENEPDANITCGFWNETTNQWEKSDRDRKEGRAQNGLYNCSYYHLTAFTLLVLGIDEDNEVLDLITKVGCSLSLTGLGLVCLAFLTLHKWTWTNLDLKLLFFLSVSLLFMYLSFLIGVPQTSHKEGCKSIVFGVLLHYFTLASFCWMFVIAFHNYLKFVKLFNTYIPRFMWKASIFSWSIPALPVIVVCSVDSDLYKQKNFCWLHSEGFTYGFLLPLSLIVLSNLGIYICILINVCNRIRNFPDSFHSTRQPLFIPLIMLSFCLFVTLGLSWVFGVPAAAGVAGNVFSYLFCIASTAQGFLVFLYFILIEKKSRSIIAGYFHSCCKQIDTKFCKQVEDDVNPLAALDQSTQ